MLVFHKDRSLRFASLAHHGQGVAEVANREDEAILSFCSPKELADLLIVNHGHVVAAGVEEHIKQTN